MSRDPIARARRAAYLTERALGDVQAARRGPGAVLRRQERRVLYRTAFRLLRKITKG